MIWPFRKAQAEPERVEPVMNMTPGTEAYEWLTGGRDATGGKPLGERDAMGIATVYACVSLIGGAIASLPLKMYQRDASGERTQIRGPVWDLLNLQMSPAWSAAVGWEFGSQSLLLRGDLFARIVRASSVSNKIVGFEPWHPDSVQVQREGQRRVYLHADEGRVRAYNQDDVIHVPGPGFDGLRGMSQIAHVLRNPANIARTANHQALEVLDGGMRPDLALIAPAGRKVGQDDIDTIRTQWETRYMGSGKSQAPIVLSGGVSIKELSLSAEDAQLLETRGFQVEEICSVFGVPPWMIGKTDKTTSWGSGVEQMGIAFSKYTLSRHLTKIEQEINRKVFQGTDQFCEFDTKGLERGDFKSRMDGYRTALGRAGEGAWMTINEVRRAENMPPIDGGDELKEATYAQSEEAAAE